MGRRLGVAPLREVPQEQHLPILRAHAFEPLAGALDEVNQGAAVAGALVIATNPLHPPFSTRTNEDGEFQFVQLADGRYDFTASAPGLQGEALGVSVTSTAPAVEITMRVSAVAETLVVSASQIDQPLSRTADSVTVISGDELDARQITTLGAALSTVPGFTVARSGGPGTLTSLFPRGGESDFTLILVDGVRAR